MHIRRIFHLIVGDVAKQHFLVLGVERRQARCELIQNNPKSVQVKRIVIARLKQHLRSHILWTSAVAICNFVFAESHLAEPEIGDPEMTIAINENIFWLQ
jgi:hypothetical protein